MIEKQRYLLDVNILIALIMRAHTHHQVARRWFYADDDRLWSTCAVTEAGFLRYATAKHSGQVTMLEALEILTDFSRHAGYDYQAITVNWRALALPLLARLQGTKQVTDALLLGLAIREDLVLVTLDKALRHLAGAEHQRHLLVLDAAS